MTTLLFVWSARIGGAERFTADLAKRLKSLGIRPIVVFVTGGSEMSSELAAAKVPFASLGLKRGREVFFRLGRLRRLVRETEACAAILPSVGFLAVALRLAGLRGKIVAVDHGSVLQLHRLSFLPRLREECNRALGIFATTDHVCVSEATLRAARRFFSGRNLIRIYNGVDVGRFAPTPPASEASEIRPGHFVIGFAARLVPGKGVDVLMNAVEEPDWPAPVVVRVAGDGPLRCSLERRARSLRNGTTVELLGPVNDMPSFYRSCDVIAVPPDIWVDSFCLVAAEAMACGRPVVASALGGIPEVVADGEVGSLVSAGDPAALRAALMRYAIDPALRRTHGSAARQWVVKRFSIDEAARHYAALLHGSPSRERTQPQ